MQFQNDRNCLHGNLTSFTRGIATTNRYARAQTHQKKIYKLDYESCHVYDNYCINIDFDFLMPGVSIASGAWAILNRWSINGYYFAQ